MKIKSIEENVHQIFAEAPLLDHPLPENNIVRIPAAPGLGLTPNVKKRKASRMQEP